MLLRTHHVARVRDLLTRFPVVGLTGARQVGKTTLAHLVGGEQATYFDLERPEDQRLFEQPMLTLQALRGLVVLDEVQRVPELFPLLRVLADRPGTPARFLVLGSASPHLLRQGSESLAGRIVWLQLSGFSLGEVGAEHLDRLWLRGGFPRSYLAGSDLHADEWRQAFLQTFLERDLPQLGIRVSPVTLRRFWTMIAHYHGQTWNGSELARAFGISAHTVRRYLDALTQALVLRQLQPWHANLSKRQVRSPKVYVADSGLLHALLDVRTHDQLLRHPKVGASWEGFALAQLSQHLGVDERRCFFWGTHAGAELDLLVQAGGVRLGVEFKRTTTPKLTRSMRVALKDLDLHELLVIHAGQRSVQLDATVRAIPASRMLQEIDPLSA